MNSNIAIYSQFIGKNTSPKPLQCDHVQFTEDEIDEINNFIKWDNEEKNKALFKLVNYCIEYAIVVNNSSEDVLSKSLKNKYFFLDNAIIYRALGINGESRKKRTLSFLKKCKESGQKFVISKITREEFKSTIDYHLSLLNHTTPFGRISPKAFKRYSNGDGFYQFYHEWRNGRLNYGFDMFKTYILNQYKELVKNFDIEEDFKVPFDEKNIPQTINTYKDEIQAIKRTHRDAPHMMDAKNMYWIECIRQNNNYDLVSTKYYFVTSDQKLQAWDNKHSTNQPLTLLPSQWMALIIKYVSRTLDDYKSFISFMNLPKDSSAISDDELQSILAGISEMTEEFSTQENIIESMVETKCEDILKGNIRENAKAFAKDKLEKDFEQKLLKNNQTLQDQIRQKEKEKEDIKKYHESILAQFKEDSRKQYELLEKERKSDKLLSINKEIGSLENRKRNADARAMKKLNRKKFIFIAIILVPILIWIYLVYRIDWNIMEKATYFPPVIWFMLSFIYAMIYGKSFNPIKYFYVLYEELTIKEYLDFEYSDQDYEEFIKMRDELKKRSTKIK